jgi:hypothetical protein
MRPVWSDIRGASLRDGHPAPFPAELAERLIRMFSFAGDTILDPFAGSGSTAVAAIRAGRSSISVEIEEEYLNAATRRAAREAGAGSSRATPRLWLKWQVRNVGHRPLELAGDAKRACREPAGQQASER